MTHRVGNKKCIDSVDVASITKAGQLRKFLAETTLPFASSAIEHLRSYKLDWMVFPDRRLKEEPESET